MSYKENIDEYEIDVPKEERKLDTVSYDYSVSYLNELIKQGKIILEVPFQRQYIWPEDKSAQLIESLILNVPIPPLYFAEEEDGKWLVIDGLQRLSSIKKFFENEYSLKKMDVIKELDKSKYKDLPPKAKGLLDDGLMRVNVIKKTSHPDIKFDIFMRLNKGSVTLNYQELRNCLYRGIFNDTLKELTKTNTDLKRILNQKKPDPRYLDSEFVLRGFALSDNLIYSETEQSYIFNGYKGKMVKYLNDYMAEKQKFNSPEISEEYTKRFTETYKKIIIVFGETQAFRDISTDNKKVYKAIMDIIYPSFERISLSDIQDKKDDLKSALIELLTTNSTFRDSITYRTSDRNVLNGRINTWMMELQKYVQIRAD